MVTFRYEPESKIFYVSLGATVLGLVLCGLVWFENRRERSISHVESAKVR
jgi:hypothetical protein